MFMYKDTSLCKIKDRVAVLLTRECIKSDSN